MTSAEERIAANRAALNKILLSRGVTSTKRWMRVFPTILRVLGTARSRTLEIFSCKLLRIWETYRYLRSILRILPTNNPDHITTYNSLSLLAA